MKVIAVAVAVDVPCRRKGKGIRRCCEGKVDQDERLRVWKGIRWRMRRRATCGVDIDLNRTGTSRSRGPSDFKSKWTRRWLAGRWIAGRRCLIVSHLPSTPASSISTVQVLSLSPSPAFRSLETSPSFQQQGTTRGTTDNKTTATRGQAETRNTHPPARARAA
jgi:hypothetical protein